MQPRAGAGEKWLHVDETVAAVPLDGSDVGDVIRWYRQREGLTQHEAAALLNTTQSRLSKLRLTPGGPRPASRPCFDTPGG